MNEAPVILLCDSREPWPDHPWRRWLPSYFHLERATLETGDFALDGLPDGAVIERKTVGDFLSCVGGERVRFERELARSRHLGAFAVVIEGDLLKQCRGIHPSAIMGSVAAWSRRYCPIIFAGGEHGAASFAWRYLTGQITEAERVIVKTSKARASSASGEASTYQANLQAKA